MNYWRISAAKPFERLPTTLITNIKNVFCMRGGTSIPNGNKGYLVFSSNIYLRKRRTAAGQLSVDGENKPLGGDDDWCRDSEIYYIGRGQSTYFAFLRNHWVRCDSSGFRMGGNLTKGISMRLFDEKAD